MIFWNALDLIGMGILGLLVVVALIWMAVEAIARKFKHNRRG